MIVTISAGFIAAFTAAHAQERQCDTARISSFSGEVEVRGADGRPIEIRRDMALCPGDSVSTGAVGGVTLYFTDKDTALILDNDAELTIPGDDRSDADATLFSGIVRLVSSVRTNFTIGSDYVTAGIDGTEMTMHAVRGVGAVVAVLEGDVTARRGAATVLLPVNNVSFAAAAGGLANVTGEDPAGLPPVFRPYVVRPAGAADWAVYFPPALIAAGAEAGQVEAARLISSGEYAAAEAVLNCAAPADRTAAALCAMSAVALNDRARLRAYEAAPLGGDAASEIAQSYVHQSLGHLSAARDAAARAVGRGAPGQLGAHAYARLAEVELILGNRDAATAAARTAADMGAPLGHAMLGFAELANANFAAAEAEFGVAASGDQSPLPLLGLGLAKIRQGDMTGGRRDLEAAVAMDPNRADLRVWLGRAYYEEGLPEKARAQYDMAKARDPDDPNAYFFTALERYAANDPIGALREVEAAEARGEGRSVLRSESGLGEDSAVRGAALGRVFDTLGFDSVAARAGADAVDRDPTNPEAHRFLADVYRTQKAGDNAQTSEMLKADLLSPPNKAPLQAQLGEADLALLETSGPTASTFAEFAPMFDANGVGFYASGQVGAQSLLGEEASVSVLHNNFSFSFSEYYYETEGFRANNDVGHAVAAAQVKYAPTPDLTLFGEYRYRHSEAGDRQLNFIIDEGFDAEVRNEFERNSARIGFRWDAGPGTLLGLGTWATQDTFRQDISDDFFIEITEDRSDEEFWGAELQYITELRGVDLIVGGSASKVHGDLEFLTIFEFPPFPPFPFPPTVLDADYEQFGGYAYASLDWPENVRWTVGLAVEDFEDDLGGDETRIHPKAGVVSEVADGLTLRAAYTSATKRRLVQDQTLEPTTVAGFPQFFDTFNGTEMEQVAAAVDFQATDDLFLGAEAAWRWFETPTTGDAQKSDEQAYRAYANYIFSDRLAFSGEVVYELFSNDSGFDFDEIRNIAVPVKARYFHPSGVFLGAGLTFVDQEFTPLGGPAQSDNFFIADVAAGYRFANGRGVASLSIRNLFDEEFNYQEKINSLAAINYPTYPRDLSVVARLTLSY